MNFKRAVLKPGREKSLLHRNMWVFSGAVETPPENAANGETVEVRSHDGKFLALAAWSPESQIRLRAWSFMNGENIDEAFFRRRLRSAAALRETSGITAAATGYRLVEAEGDGLPGVVIDLYGDYAVIQLASSGAEAHRAEILAALAAERPGLRGVYERSDLAVRNKEGLAERSGTVAGEEPPERVTFTEHGLTFAADVRRGHKTGFYFDQRANRLLARRLASGRRVLNLFSYTGGFGTACAAGGAAEVENVDSSRPALALADHNMQLNGIGRDRYRNVCANAFELLRRYIDDKRTFDLVVLDPPKLADSRNNLMKACRAYKDLALCAFKLLPPGGLLLTFSCSGLVDAELFAKLTSDGASDAGTDAAILARLTQDADHPVRLGHPETAYLKGLLAMKVD